MGLQWTDTPITLPLQIGDRFTIAGEYVPKTHWRSVCDRLRIWVTLGAYQVPAWPLQRFVVTADTQTEQEPGDMLANPFFDL